MSDNHLTSLPKEIGNLENLIYFELSGSPLKELPNELSQLKKLEKLGLDSKVSSLPSALIKLIPDYQKKRVI
jgi:Leucine-rich repeat (LRR) protein